MGWEADDEQLRALRDRLQLAEDALLVEPSGTERHGRLAAQVPELRFRVQRSTPLPGSRGMTSDRSNSAADRAPGPAPAPGSDG